MRLMIADHIIGNYSFRRTLKHARKLYDRQSVHMRDRLLTRFLSFYGLCGDFSELQYALRHNVSGRYYFRLGQVALSKKSLVSLKLITSFAIDKKDLRKIPFIEAEFEEDSIWYCSIK